ncbi:Di-and tricarboxylate transporter [Oribacterium sp. KHPX15]|uniref:SLC13 family permease n=1 Tax=Oribacterium sp. KHPX15 TaxID=1855342 RepID=UPI00089D7298|nr:SLC13 family permease [Oribacterium sp. KHPX15]SEA93935.1 Di-and tricarboxylate transporter [Oribacterium sp. KHPX15]
MGESLVLGIVLGVMVLFVVMMLSGRFSFGLIGLSCIAILVLSGAAPMEQALSGFYDKNVVMLAGMFAIAGMLGKTRLVESIKTKLTSGQESGKGDLRIVLSLLVIAVILAQFMTSQSSIIMIMMSFMMGICEESEEIKLSRILLPLTFVMTAFMGKFPVGSTGVTTYLMLNQFIEASGSNQMLDVLSLMKCTLIPGIIGLLYCAFTYKMLPKKDVDTSAFKTNKKGDDEKLDKKHEMIVYIGFIIAVAGLFLSAQLGARAMFIPVAICIIMIFTGTMKENYFLNSLIHGPVPMCATILGIANVLTASGAGDIIGNGVLKILGGNPSPLMIVSVFAFVTIITTSFISNTATFMVLVPIACSVCAAAGYDPRAAVVACFSCSLLSVLTPMANTGSAITYSACNLSVKNTFLWAFPCALICTVATIANCLYVYPMR